MIEHYKQNDLYKLLDSLQKAVYSGSKERLFTNIHDLDEILDNIWQDARKIKNLKEGISYGKAIVLGIGGPVLGYSLGDYPGLLASMGFSVASNLIGLKESYLNDKIIKLIKKDYMYNYMYNIYDFQKRFDIE